MDKASLNRIADQAGDVVNIQFRHEPRAVGLRGPRADAEQRTDLFHIPALGNELEHFPFAGTEQIACAATPVGHVILKYDA